MGNPALSEPPVENHIIAAGPVRELIQPTALLVNCLPQVLIVDLVNYYTREMARRHAAGFLEQGFDDWIADIYRDVIYGKAAAAHVTSD